ncbi:ribosomal protein S18 acetylase RimI-like enzyme [Saccharothrix tamanrassetensis]|uniref:Ribosomal protein S18 acetylase RimI-like enzyme n=1 Tax=Saccharothrix tamanrassetensis TaxID=1051531 RepID=A0A841CGJ4_9PSEU|nr:GNAT family N-acetyltransferase [Saccharothrix tamanrassetensis]MBB5955298.1 ribosomal protein S18 acetylase RimI-like enzyme [Saccharothrix tamanrassetensis]
MTEIVELLSADVPADAEEPAEVLGDAVADGASIGFLDPLPRPHAVSWWRARAAAVANGVPAVWVARTGGRVVGTVQVRFASALNGTHRAEIAKLVVLRRMRGCGLGRELLAAAEKGAADRGATLLTLDTRTGSAAESLYRSAGWTEVGVIPDYAADPDGTLRPTTLFYRRI